jgi:hypothetical protein
LRTKENLFTVKAQCRAMHKLGDLRSDEEVKRPAEHVYCLESLRERNCASRCSAAPAGAYRPSLDAVNQQ